MKLDDLQELQDVSSIIGNYSNCYDWYNTIAICITVIILALIIARTIYCINKNSLPKPKEEEGKDCTPQTPADKEKPKDDTQEKERKEFINFCYEMARSTEEKNTTLKNDCWEFLKNTFTENKKIIEKIETTQNAD